MERALPHHLDQLHLPIRVTVIFKVRFEIETFFEDRFHVGKALQTIFAVIAPHTAVADTPERKL